MRAYLSVEEILAAAQQAGADAVYPGYGFLSENPDLARACEEAGITFVGPSADILELTGNKARAVAAAREAGVPVLGSSRPSTDVDELIDAATEVGFPVFVKAVAGGGGRGMRRVEDPAKLRESIEAASREAESAFGDATVFLEKAVVDPRHIEVQILADGQGNVIHLYERDCSVQRRHQKVDRARARAEPRSRAARAASAPTRSPSPGPIGYRNAGTVEFLLDRDGNHVFIEMNPRIQVEHTVTEEVTDVDLVQSQLRIAAGEIAGRPRPHAGRDHVTAPRCSAGSPPRTRPTASVPTPARSARTAPRAAPASGSTAAPRTPVRDQRPLRLDAGEADLPGTRLRHRGAAAPGVRWPSSASAASPRTSRSCKRCWTTPTSAPGSVTTSFIEERPHLLTARHSADRGTSCSPTSPTSP